MKKVTTFLWFNGRVEDAAKFYASLFRGAKVTAVTPGGPKAEAMSATFSLDGQDFILFNGGPVYPLTPAASLSVDCKTQAEIDRHTPALRVGHRPLRPHLADRPVGLAELAARQGREGIGSGPQSHARHEEARHRQAEARLRPRPLKWPVLAVITPQVTTPEGYASTLKCAPP